jgi:phosphatidylserine/phosphatidylglycerophosphate/cardiolipin synthase-like enzyme
VAGDRAFVGSANFTRKGLAGRDELAVTLDEPELVDELRSWFGELWSISSPAELDDLDEFINTPPPTSGGTNRQPAVSISSDATEITSALLEDTDQKSKTVETANSAREKKETNETYLAQMHTID